MIRRLAGQVLEELNVKALHVAGDDVDFLKYRVRPKLPVLGPKYGPGVSRIQRALAQDDAGVHAFYAHEIEAGRSITVDEFELLPEEVLVDSKAEPGYAAETAAGYVVAITTKITPELADEGLAREIVRHVQELRKNAGLEISDRIRLHYDGDEDIARVMRSWAGYISAETLAQAISQGAGPGVAAEEVIESHQVRLAVEKT